MKKDYSNGREKGRTGERIFEDAVNLEKKLWNREDYGEEDITLFSNIMDYIENNKEDFINSFEN